MDTFLSAFVGDLASRSLSFLIDSCLKKAEEPSKEERLDSLQRLLLRVRVVVEEAGERHVTNQAMLLQLNTLRKEMYRGYYTLDTFRCQHHDHRADDGVSRPQSSSFALSRFNPAKRVLFSSSSDGLDDDELKQVLWSLETALADVNECIVFLSTCPRLLSRQPYSMHLILDKCMFGRQMELHHIVTFLLQTGTTCHGGDEPPGILPIIGPRRVGKSTLVDHACNDERVRDHFSQIVFFTRNDIEGESAGSSLRDGGGGGALKHRINRVGRVLIVVELDSDKLTENLDEDVIEVLWHRLYSVYKQNCIPGGSKIIVTSRSDKIARLGTALPLRLHFFSRESYWYLFKTLTFRAMDAVERPELASIAMDMAAVLDGCFLGANIFSGLLRSNVDARFWSAALATLREFKRRNHMSGPREAHPWEVNSAIRIPSVSEHVVILDDDYRKTIDVVSARDDQAGAGAEAPPMVTIVDIMLGRARPRGKFDVLAWRSHLPPHHSYVLRCQIRRPRRVVASKKRMQKQIGS